MSNSKNAKRDRPETGKWWLELNNSTAKIFVRKRKGALTVNGQEMAHVTAVAESSDTSSIKDPDFPFKDDQEMFGSTKSLRYFSSKLFLADHRQNPQEFPQSFMKGVWEGLWWALVTMTTVGYGDRSPKSTLGRVFCILWIITGLIIISIFIAMVTASLAATTHPHFPIHGSLIGVVNGSEEYQLGVLMNADMKIFRKVYEITDALLKSEIDGAFFDSFMITAHLNLIRDHPGLRVERTIEHPVMYGMVLAKNSSHMEACARRYAENYPRRVFQIIAHHLKPLKNPNDATSQEVKAAEGLFYEEGAFKMIVYCGVAILALLCIAGFLYEFLAKKYLHPRRLGNENNYQNVEMTKQSSQDEQNPGEGDLDELLQDYKTFHDSWVERCKRLHGKPLHGC